MFVGQVLTTVSEIYWETILILPLRILFLFLFFFNVDFIF